MRKIWNLIRVICIIIICIFLFMVVIGLIAAAGIYIKNKGTTFYPILFWVIEALLFAGGMIFFVENVVHLLKKDTYDHVEGVMDGIKRSSSSTANGVSYQTYYPIYKYYYNGKYDHWVGNQSLSFENYKKYKDNEQLMAEQKINLLIDQSGYACYEKEIVPNLILGLGLILLAAIILFFRFFR